MQHRFAQPKQILGYPSAQPAQSEPPKVGSSILQGLKQIVAFDGQPEPQTPMELVERLINGGRSLKQMYDQMVSQQKHIAHATVETAHTEEDAVDAADMIEPERAPARTTRAAPAPAAPTPSIAQAPLLKLVEGLAHKIGQSPQGQA